MKKQATQYTNGASNGKREKTGALLINLGSPDSTSIPDVRRYLDQFLMDKRVIDAPYLIRRMIVSCFILPKRPKESAEAYESIWWKEGSPLIVLSQELQKLVQAGVDVPVSLGMRYGNPSIEAGVQELLDQGVNNIFLIPLYPHYAMATVETVIVETRDVLKKLNVDVRLTVKEPFFDDPDYIDALVDSAEKYLQQGYDHLLFSYHGLPERHCKKTDPTGKHCLKVDNCCEVASLAHQYCYRHQVFRTSQDFVEKAGIPQEKHTIAFQSKLGVDAWLTPSTEDELVRLGKAGTKRLLVICPAFVSDCIETLEEIGMRGKETFQEAGGGDFHLIPCINDDIKWVRVLQRWINNLQGDADYFLPDELPKTVLAAAE